MAFEDAVVLCRTLRQHKEQNAAEFLTSKSVECALRDFECSRLPRVRKLWKDQWERSEAAYKNIIMEPWSSEFSEWVFQGV